MKRLSLLLFVGALAAVSSSYARTSNINFNKPADDVDVWTAIKDYTSNGPTELAKMATEWTDQIKLHNGYTANDVRIVLSSNFSDGYPSPEEKGAANFNFLLGSNVSMTVTSGGVLGMKTKTSDYKSDTSTGYGELIFEGNSTLTVEGTGRVVAGSLIMNRNGGGGTIIVKDTADFWTRSTAYIGAATDTKASTLRLEGSKLTNAHTRNLRFVGNADTSVDNVMGGCLQWVADADGITTLVNESTPQQAMTGVLSLDFSALVWQEAWGETKQFTVISCTGTSDYLTDWVSNAGTLGEIITQNGRITDPSLAFFSADQSKLYVTLAKAAVIPEPSTYAAILGALALGFVAYRRRK